MQTNRQTTPEEPHHTHLLNISSSRLPPTLLVHTINPRNKAQNLELSTLSKSANLQLGSVLGQDLVVVVLPEGLGCVLAGHALEDLCAAGVLVEEGYFHR